MNDSFIDFDLLARVDPDTNKILGPSVYSEMVWNARQLRAQAGLKPIDWVVLRNRLGAQAMHNKKKIGDAMQELSKRIGFRVAPGFSERVIFRELFPRGLTLLDLKDIGVKSCNEHFQRRRPSGSARSDEGTEPAGCRGHDMSARNPSSQSRATTPATFPGSSPSAAMRSARSA